jgi:hypothetical protein
VPLFGADDMPAAVPKLDIILAKLPGNPADEGAVLVGVGEENFGWNSSGSRHLSTHHVTFLLPQSHVTFLLPQSSVY